MSDYSFMKSGFNMVDTGESEDMQKNVVVMVSTFSNEGLKHAAYYVNHHPTRDYITPEDIKRGMMLEVFLFSNRPDLLDRMEEIKAIIYGEDSEEENSEEEDENKEESDEDEEDAAHDDQSQKFTPNSCDCAICKCMNTIYNRWGKWTPSTPFETIIKANIDKIPTSVM